MAGGVGAVLPTAGAVFDLIRRGDATTRGEVAAVTGLSRTAVTARLAMLLASGLIVEAEEAASTGGRPPVRLRINARAGAVIAISIGRSRVQMAICDLDGAVMASAEFDQPENPLPDVVFPLVRSELDRLLREVDVTRGSVRGIGLGLPATVDTATRVCVASTVMHGWDGVPLAPYFADFANAVVHVENDANALALSEVHGHLRRYRDLIVLKASTGLGCGVFVDGHLVRGAIGAAGEIGHTKSSAAAGRLCRCGDVGCLEAVAAGWALVQQAAADGHGVAHIRELVASAVEGRADARHQIRESGRRIGEHLAAAVNLLNPGAIVVAGDMAEAYDIFVAGVRETLYAGTTALGSHDLEIMPATEGDMAGLVGCAQLAVADVLDRASIDRYLAHWAA